MRTRRLPGSKCTPRTTWAARNHGWDEHEYLRGLPAGATGEIHFAGHSVRRLENGRTLRVDDHGSAVCDDVWELYEIALAQFGSVPTLIEWDNDVPPLDVLIGGARKAQQRMEAQVAQPA
jgi:hypothetical protein